MMRFSHDQLKKEKITPLFYKLLGTGGGSGFDWYPDFGTYGFLATWQNKEVAQNFFNDSSWYLDYVKKSEKYSLFHMTPIKSHGEWSGKHPFTPSSDSPTGRVAVITRATIKWKYLPVFWSKVPRVSDVHNESPGLIYSKGIGEYPLKQQATFSVWENIEAMKAFSYQGAHHKSVIALTRKLNWYSEELFARFSVDAVEGNLLSSIQ